jgi:hypothetical protein
MTGEAHWFEVALVVGGGAAIAAYVWFAARTESLVLRQRLNFTCPVMRVRVGATLLEDLRSDQYTDVKRCSGWQHFWKPCAKACLAPLNKGLIGEERLHAVRPPEIRSLVH